MRTRILIPTAAIAVAILLSFVCATVARADARPVALTDAHYAPTTLAYMYPHTSITLADAACPRGGFYSDVSAYRWDGRALSAQTRVASRHVWRDSRGHAVTWDGATVRNHTNTRVIFAGWCES